MGEWSVELGVQMIEMIGRNKNRKEYELANQKELALKTSLWSI